MSITLVMLLKEHNVCVFSVTVEAYVAMRSFINFFIFAFNNYELLQLKTLEI